jgi:hypothetical protein
MRVIREIDGDFGLDNPVDYLPGVDGEACPASS